MNKLSVNDRQKLDNFNSMSVGHIFQKTREEQNIDLMQISAHLNIGSTHLDAIEKNDIKALPPKVYAVGFVRAYADALGLDAEKMAYLFKVQAYGKKQTDHQKEIIKSEGKTVNVMDAITSNRSVIPLVIGGLILVSILVTTLFFLVTWLLSPSDNRNEFQIPAVPLEMLEGASRPLDSFVEKETDSQAENLASEPTQIIIKPDEGARAYGADALDSALALKILSDNWIEIRSVKKGKLLFSETLQKGDVYYVREGDDILLTTNNGGGIEAYLDNQSLGLLGQEGDVVRLRPLSVKALRLQRGQ